MRIRLALIILLFPFVAANAQQEIIDISTQQIVAGKFEEAHQYLDSILKTQPDNLDALMMKGNVILNEAIMATPPMQFISASDESVFSFQISMKPKLLPQSVVHQVEPYWKKCLKLQPERSDMIKGLCSIYAMSLMKDELKESIKLLKKIEPDDGEQVFRTADYARKIKERNAFEDGMEVYQFIASLYTNIAGIRCDIASEYFYAGKMNEALVWIDSSYNFVTVDEASFLNGAFIYSELGYFDNAQNVLNAYSRIYKRKMDVFYYGLRLFADTSSKSFDVLKNFCETIDTSAYFTEYTLAQKLISDSTFSFSTYNSIGENKDIPDYYKILIDTRAMKQYPDSCNPFFWFGVHQATIKNYAAASKYLEGMQGCLQGEEVYDYPDLYYYFSLYMSGETQASLKGFYELENSGNVFVAEASRYFILKNFVSNNQMDIAGKYFTEKFGPDSKTKYASLAEQLLR